ncbi:hypothetical protein [Sphingobium subterraneum]|uniref:Uncharacterized protein n=1 Tax=Sphingobium subterraneum TaxID=627688 RepID=A0A841J2K7_9SPHN|nr:hypothetical protein [Sphingobium subterraneum]MBB6124582.1 hypothetical protein [Sphingobium subterraneum]
MSAAQTIETVSQLLFGPEKGIKKAASKANLAIVPGGVVACDLWVAITFAIIGRSQF